MSKSQRTSLHFEQLENRQLLSAQPVLPEWLITAGGPGSDSIISAAIHPSGDILVTGNFSNTVDFDPGPAKIDLTSAGDSDVFIARYTPAGKLVWAQRQGGAANDSTGSIATDADGSTYAVANFSGANGPIEIGGVQYPVGIQGSAGFLFKMDTAANIVWVRQFPSNGAAGNPLSGVTIDDRDPNPANWSVLVSGKLYGTGQFGNQTIQSDGHDGYVSKLSAANGDFHWTQIVGGANSYRAERIALAGPGENAFYVLGQHQIVTTIGKTTQVTYDNWLAKMNSVTGATLWLQTIAAGTSDGRGSTVGGALTANSTNVFVGGNFSGMNVDFDPGPGVYSLTSAGDQDAAILALDSAGNFDWAWRRGAALTDRVLGMTVSDAGSVYATGMVDGVHNANRRSFLEQFDSAGVLVAEYTYPGSSSGIAVDLNENLYVGGISSSPRLDLYPTGDRAGNVDSSIDIRLLKFSPNAPPIASTLSIDEFTASPESVLSGDSVTLRVSRVHDPDIRFQTINFYRDNGDGVFNAADDMLIASDADSANGWATTTTAAGLATGEYTYFAEGTDINGIVLDVAAVTVQVQGVETVSFANTTAMQIRDRSTITSTITVPDAFTVLDLDVQLNISHTYDADLYVFLIGPTGTRVQLFADIGGSSDNFSGTILDDEAATLISSGIAPFAGRFKPQGSLTAFDGQNAGGTWTLEITDDARKNTGTLHSWSLNFSRAVETAPLAAAVSETKAGDGDGAASALLFDAAAVDELVSQPKSSWTHKGRFKMLV